MVEYVEIYNCENSVYSRFPYLGSTSGVSLPPPPPPYLGYTDSPVPGEYGVSFLSSVFFLPVYTHQPREFLRLKWPMVWVLAT